MKQKTTLIILAICGLSFAVVMILFAMAEKPISYRQHFTRNHHLGYATLENVLAVSKGHYIAGATDGRYYFGNENDPLELTVTDTQLNVIEVFRLPIGESQLEDSRIEVDSSTIYLKAGQLPAIFTCSVNNRLKCTLQPVPYFLRAVLVSGTTFVLQARGNDSEAGTANNLLFVASTRSAVVGGVIKLSNDVDGYFASQGELRYCKDLHRLVYTHYYHNRLIAMDTSLIILYEGRTLDSITIPALKPIEVEEGYYSLASASVAVNLSSQISGTNLIIHSNLMALNDDQVMFDQSAVLDVYDIGTMQYKFSFNLPDYNSRKMETFRVFSNRLVAIYPDAILGYSIEHSQ